MAGVGVFYKKRSETLRNTRQTQVERVAQAQLNLRKDVQLTLAQVSQHLESEDLKKARQSLRRASILDLIGEFTGQVYELKTQIIKLEQTIAQREELEELASSISVSLKAGELSTTDSLLQEYLQVVQVEDEVYVSLKKQYDSDLRRAQKIQTLTKVFAIAVADWNETQAIEILEKLRSVNISDELIAELGRELKVVQKVNLEVASIIPRFNQADTGQYSADLLDDIDLQIKRLGGHPKLLAVREKIRSHPQTIRVPAEVASIDEAYAQLRDGGTIELGEGVFYTEIEFDKSVVIKGAGVGITILESRTKNAAGLHFSHPKGNYKVSHLALRGFLGDAGGYPLLLLSGGKLDLSHVEISRSANHGMAVTSGTVKIQECEFFSNRWDGLAVFGASSLVTVKDSNFHENADHGVDVWGGAKAQLTSSSARNNSKSGIVASGEKSLISLTDVSSNANRECGIYLSLGASLVGKRVKVCNNRFSGLIAQSIHHINWVDSDASSNGEFGYLIDRLSAGKLVGELRGEENVIGLVSQKRLK